VVGVTVTTVKHRDPTLAIAGALQKVIEMAAMNIEAEAKQLAPVDTGNLRASIGASSEGPLSWVVRASAHYAVYVEMGTRYMAAQPFMRPAVERARARLSAMPNISVGV
jgi:HK97 gp10 family phage protein